MVGTEGTVGVGEDSVWAVTENDTLTRINANSGEVEAKISLPDDGASVVVDFGSAWVTSTFKDELYRVDPKTNAVAATIPLNRYPRFIASGAGSIWVLNQGDGTVQRVDPNTNKVTATIKIGRSAIGGDIATGGGYVWVSMQGTPVAQINPKNNILAHKFSGGWGDAIRFGVTDLGFRRINS